MSENLFSENIQKTLTENKETNLLLCKENAQNNILI